MKKLILLSMLALLCADAAYARGGVSSGGGRGSFSSGRSFSSPSRSYSSPSRSTVTTTTTTRSGGYGGGYRGYGGMGYHPMMYPGFGMGYGYHMGLLDYLIIGQLMHPQGTTVYQGGGLPQGNSALLYPDGRVVDQNGYQVGTYVNGVFTAMANGPMVAQQAPAGALQQAQAQPVVLPPQQDDSGAVVEAVFVIGVIVVMIALLILI